MQTYKKSKFKKKREKKVNHNRYKFIQKQQKLSKIIRRMEKRSTDLPTTDEILALCRQNIINDYSKDLPEFLLNFDGENAMFINDVVKKNRIN